MRARGRGVEPVAHRPPLGPLALLFGLGLLVGAYYDRPDGRTPPLVAIVDGLGALVCLAIAAGWYTHALPRRAAEPAMVVVAGVAVAANVVSVVSRDLAGSAAVAIPYYLSVIPLTFGALLTSRRLYALVSALALAGYVLESVAVGGFEPFLAAALPVSVAGGWLLQSARRAFLQARVAAEAARAEADAASARAERLATLGAIVGSVSHEVNNPLTFMSGNADSVAAALDAALADAALAPARRAELEEARRAAASLHRGLDRIESATRALRLLADNVPSSTVPDLQALLADALLLAQMRVPPHVELSFERGPASAARVDGRDLFQLVLALVADAGEACAPHGGRITVSTRVSDDELAVVVEDEAPFRGEDGRQGGALSLARASELARAAGVLLLVERREPRGTRRILALPRGRVEARPARE